VLPVAIKCFRGHKALNVLMLKKIKIENTFRMNKMLLGDKSPKILMLGKNILQKRKEFQIRANY
jgi:hypothetical protein